MWKRRQRLHETVEASSTSTRIGTGEKVVCSTISRRIVLTTTWTTAVVTTTAHGRHGEFQGGICILWLRPQSRIECLSQRLIGRDVGAGRNGIIHDIGRRGTGSRRHMCLSVSASIRAERSVVTMMTDGRDVIDAS